MFDERNSRQIAILTDIQLARLEQSKWLICGADADEADKRSQLAIYRSCHGRTCGFAWRRTSRWMPLSHHMS